jgi:hypothetical protein
VREQPSGAAALWRAEARLRQDRRRALAELERCFASGSSPGWLDGPFHGRLVTTTIEHGLDVVVEAATRAWMPWEGKAFAPERAEGRNRFDGAARPFLRALWPGYRDLLPDGSGGFTAFRFDTGVGESATARGLEVLRLDYDHPDSPWPARLTLDELVEVGGGQYLGQALMRWGGGYRRIAWFALEPPG